MQDAPFCINLVEQGHAAGATCIRDHPAYSCKALSARCALQQMKPLTTPSQLECKVANLNKKINKLDAYEFNRITGRHAFMKELMAACAPSGGGPDAATNLASSQAVVGQYSELYKQLPLNIRAQYEDVAAADRDAARRRINTNRGAFEAEIAALELAKLANIENIGLTNHVEAVKTADDDLQKVCDSLDEPSIS